MKNAIFVLTMLLVSFASHASSALAIGRDAAGHIIGYGTSYDAPSRAFAEAAAIRRCNDPSCQIVDHFDAIYLVIATAPIWVDGFGWAINLGESTAVNDAMNACRAATNSSECKVIFIDLDHTNLNDMF